MNVKNVQKVKNKKGNPDFKTSRWLKMSISNQMFDEVEVCVDNISKKIKNFIIMKDLKIKRNLDVFYRFCLQNGALINWLKKWNK